MAENKMAICIARQFGSGGREVGMALAHALNIPFYDKELLHHAAQKSGILQELFERNDEKAVSSLSSSPFTGRGIKAASFEDYISYVPDDRMQNVISEVIRDVAGESSCVIIGRCADYILRGQPGTVSVFVHAPLESRIKRVARMHNIDEDAARRLIRKTDHNRANYYSFYTDRDWAAADNYDIVLDAGRLGVGKTAEVLQHAAPRIAGLAD